MEIFGIGPAELFLILLVAFVVLGPERLPAAARALGQWIRQVRVLSNELTRQLNAELGETGRDLRAAQQELQSLRNLPREISTQLGAELADVKQELQTAQEELRQTGQALVDINPNGNSTAGDSTPESPQESATSPEDLSETQSDASVPPTLPHDGS